MLASVSVLGRAELGSFGVVICVGIDMFGGQWNMFGGQWQPRDVTSAGTATTAL